MFVWNIKAGMELLSLGATPLVSSPQLRFTHEFGMVRSGSTTLDTPAIALRIYYPQDCIIFQ